MTRKHERIFSSSTFVPSKDDLCEVFKEALKENFNEVECKVAACPDLRRFGLAAEGLGGEVDYAECGTILGSMFNPGKQHDVFNLPETAKCFGRENAFVIGAGAGSTDEFRVNSEWTGNAILEDSRVSVNNSRVAYITDMTKLPETVTVKTADRKGEFGCIGNLLFTAGTQGDVVQIRARVRKSEKNWSADPHEQEFIRILRTAMAKKWPEPHQQVVVGGVMMVVKGNTVTHVMPPYFPPSGAKPGKSFPDMGGWSERFFLSKSQLVACTTMLNHQGNKPDNFQWRLDHTHFYTQDGKEAGHYHYDVDPEVVEYVAFLVPASRCHKIDLLGFSKL
eukprot:TRINITY_DN6151_c8_g1_i1.p1 TRINITY_DN6151_c8_g1~~TRINITY_DN6151_c8_g1_i1.p1  ORF type:complete len:353 (+),score=35.03 TRINITY_DN6151_c8_g1_i1:55-1059(+)